VSARQVRTPGRQIYGRAMPLARPSRRRPRVPSLGLLQRRLLMLAVGLMVVAYVLSQAFAITTVTVSAPSRGEEIKAETMKSLAGSWRQRNLLTLDSGELVSDLQQADPLLRSVEARRKWFHGITITALLKQPSLGWSTGNQKYLLDRDGTAIGMLPLGSKLPVVNDGSNLPVQIGGRVAAARFVSFVAAVVPALAAEGIGAQSLDVKDTTLDLSVTTNKGYRLIFDTGRGVDDEMVDLRAVVKLLAAQKKAPAEYIDLRIAGKAYYK
jgi:cell division septal protein FtsQ